MSVLQRIVLASASPRRLELLRSLNLDVRVVPSTYDEPAHPGVAPRDLAILHARHKAYEVRTREGGEAIVAADTVVDVDGIPYGKPRDSTEATRMLRDLSGRTHVVHTAFTLALPQHADVVEACESTRVTFFGLSNDEIANYVASGEPLDKAGAYGIQGFAATLIQRIDGDFYTVMGFPIARFVRTLRRLGFTTPIPNQNVTIS